MSKTFIQTKLSEKEKEICLTFSLKKSVSELKNAPPPPPPWILTG